MRESSVSGLANALLVSRGFLGSAAISNSPDDSGAVVCDQECAVFCYGDADGAAPDVSFGRDEAHQKVFVIAGCLAVLHGNANDLVAGSPRPVPGTVFGGECVEPVLFRELAAGVKRHAQR